MQTTTLENIKKRKKFEQCQKNVNLESFPGRILLLLDDIQVGDWCFFDAKDIVLDLFEATETVIQNIVIGCVLSFKYIHGKTDREKQYCQDIANRQENSELKVLALWYAIDSQKNLLVMKNGSFHLSIKKYIATTNEPEINENNKKWLGDLSQLEELYSS